MDATEMLERCGRHQHPELFGGREVDATCSVRVAREILEMTCDRAPIEPTERRAADEEP